MKSDKLKQIISESGLKKSYIAKALNLSYSGFQLKMNGSYAFRVDEVSKLCDVLGIDNSERDDIFFTN